MFLSVCLEEFGGGIGKLKYRPNQNLPLLFILVTPSRSPSHGLCQCWLGGQEWLRKDLWEPLVKKKRMFCHWEMNFNTHKFLFCQVSLSALNEQVR